MKFFDDGKGGFTQGFGMGGTRSFHLMTIFTILSGTHIVIPVSQCHCAFYVACEGSCILGQRPHFFKCVTPQV